MVMLVPQNPEPKVVRIRYIDVLIKPNEAIGIARPTRILGYDSGEVLGNSRIGGECGYDVTLDGLYVDQRAHLENQGNKEGCLEGRCELLLSEDWAKVLRIDLGIVLIPLFGVDVPASSQCIWYRSEPSGMEPDNHIELAQKFGPANLSPSQNLCGAEILEIFVVSNDVNRSTGTFKVMPPRLEGIKNGEEVFIVSIVVEFGRGKCA